MDISHPENIDSLKNKTKKYESECIDLEKELQNPNTVKDHNKYKKVSLDYNEIKSKFESAKKLLDLVNSYIETQEISKTSEDPEMKEFAQIELIELSEKIKTEQNTLNSLEIEVDPHDKGNAIIEIRAGAGGDEAALFAQDMYRAYTKFAESLEYSIDIANLSYASGPGGFKEIIFFISGPFAFRNFKYENGVHRVQRIPETESAGRIHTSAASVVVLPESDDVEIEVNDEDLRIDVYRSSGPGGQSVNTTDSAVRIVHEPTGIIVTCQDEKSQHKNKAKALKILKAKLYDIALAEKQAEEAKLRKSAIKSGDRSAKIRTYNYPQSRVTDHRIQTSWHNLEDVMNGNFIEIVEALAQYDQDQQLSEINE